jgi:hypothetical protein
MPDGGLAGSLVRHDHARKLILPAPGRRQSTDQAILWRPHGCLMTIVDEMPEF